jgi:curved DNA-binding protein CbpA
METESHYQILGVSENSRENEIKKAYRRLASLYHPDKVEHLGPRLKELAGEELRKLNESKSVLLDKTLRAQYDMELNKTKRTPMGPDADLEVELDDTVEVNDLSEDDLIEDENYFMCGACGFPNLQTNEFCEKCEIDLSGLMQVEFVFHKRIHKLEKKLRDMKITAPQFFEAVRSFEKLYSKTLDFAIEQSMENRMEFLSERLINKELTPEGYFEEISNLREWWQR